MSGRFTTYDLTILVGADDDMPGFFRAHFDTAALPDPIATAKTPGMAYALALLELGRQCLEAERALRERMTPEERAARGL